MTNFEYYKEQILEEVTKDSWNLALTMNDQVDSCSKLNCCYCKFSTSNSKYGLGNCNANRYTWLYEEHIEKPTITKQERAFLEICDPECYIARDKLGTLYLYTNKPVKESNGWRPIKGDLLNITHYNRVMFAIKNSDGIYSFIKWEDEKPWKVEDLLKLEVK